MDVDFCRGVRLVLGFAKESCGYNYGIWMKMGMKEEMGVDDKIILTVMGSSACGTHNCVHSAPKCTYSRFLEAGSEVLQWKSA